MEIDELAKFAREAGDRMKKLEPITSDADTVVEQLNNYKVMDGICLLCLVTLTFDLDL